jgi:DNA-binding HxlR family transcriptional regulator
MAKRFDQYCPIAHALSLIGERWSLLVVRELLKGPRRYTDLAAGLPGIGTNILASRLRALEDGGVIRRRKLPPPAASTVYELTEYGEDLDEAMHALARWGIRTLGPPGPKDELEPDWGLNAFAAMLDPEAARDVHDTYVIRVADDVFTIRIDDGCIATELGATADAPDLDIATDMETFYLVAAHELDPLDAVEQGRMTLRGEPETLRRCFTVLSFAPRGLAAAARSGSLTGLDPARARTPVAAAAPAASR